MAGELSRAKMSTSGPVVIVCPPGKMGRHREGKSVFAGGLRGRAGIDLLDQLMTGIAVGGGVVQRREQLPAGDRRDRAAGQRGMQP